jgi:uncharacterized protein (DUF849 family)
MKLIVNLAPTGMIPTKEMTPHVPMSATEVAQDVVACASIGITSVHLHARDAGGCPTYLKAVYARMIEEIRGRLPEAVICVSCSGRDFPDFEQRAEVLELDGDLRPDLASLTLSSLNFPRSASVNSPEVIRRLAETMRDRGIKPELEVFDLGMANYARYLVDKGVLEPPLYANVFLGNVATAQATLLELGILIASLPDGCFWSVAGIGATQLPMNAVSIACGGGVRVGLEDNIWDDEGRTRLATNAGLVERIAALGRIHGREIMTPQEFRDLVGLDAAAQEPSAIS